MGNLASHNTSSEIHATASSQARDVVAQGGEVRIRIDLPERLAARGFQERQQAIIVDAQDFFGLGGTRQDELDTITEVVDGLVYRNQAFRPLGMSFRPPMAPKARIRDDLNDGARHAAS
jgi:hypothetical protein